jgi:hypothetical protein
MTIELFENKAEHYFVIKEGDSVLRLTEEEFNRLKKTGKSPLLTRLWHQAKKERMEAGVGATDPNISSTKETQSKTS